MLVEFSVENFRSFRERVTLSMIAAKLRARDPQLDCSNVIEVSDKLALLRSAVIYGANASGKSNIVKAMRFMRMFVAGSAREGQEEDAIQAEPFLLNTDTSQRPSTLEIVFLIEGIQYRYGFSVNAKCVVAEWLYYVPTIREVELFTRDAHGIHLGGHFKEGRGLEARTRDNALFLSVAAQFNGEIAKRVRRWFVVNCRLISGITDRGYLPYTMQCLDKGLYREKIEELIRRLDLDIAGITIGDELPSNSVGHALVQPRSRSNAEPENSEEASLTASGITSKRARKELFTRHLIRDEKGKIVEETVLPAQMMESEGTQKIIALAGPLLDTLSNGWVLFVDEIDARLHPLITAAIIQLFNSLETNPKNAQLICATHDTNLLDRHLFRRDQIYFVEKDQTSASHLYSLADFKLEIPEGGKRTPRNDASFEKNYIHGRYGAIPYLGNIDRLFIEELHSKDRTGDADPTRQDVEAWGLGMVVAIDGPAGAGKSTVARRVARELGLTYVDTGAMYRAVAWLALRRNLASEDEPALVELAEGMRLTLSPLSPAGEQRVSLNGEDVTAAIRTPEVSQLTSRVWAVPGLRRVIVARQRQLGREAEQGIVLEGRDIGTVVFPNADVKVFLTASPEERAHRRAAELRARGLQVDADAVLAEQKERDARDSHRADSPLVAAPDAVVLDTDGLTIDEVVTRILDLCRRVVDRDRL